MSDELDADLYGDLYETEGGEPSEQNQTTKTSPQTQAGTSSKEETTTELEDLAEDITPPNSTEKEPQAPQATLSISNTASATIPTAATQQIPTYEDNPSSGYRDVPLQQGMANQGYQTPVGIDLRSVRPSEMKDEGKMFIGGLHWDTTDDGLRDYFSQFGKVEACTIMRDATGRSRCFAFLTFEDPASVNRVMVQEHFLDGKVIDPKRAIPREEHQRATKLFIGGLAGSVTSESMREFFSQFGRVIDSTVMLDRETGRSKGFGFVSLEDVDVRPFLGFGNLEIDGKLIDVKLAQPRYQRENFSEDQQYDSSGGSNGGRASAGGFNNNFQGGNAGGNMGAAFDPQALAALYTRMFQMAGGSANMMGGGGMGGMGGGGMGNMGMNPMMSGNMRGGMMGQGMGNMGMGAGRGGMAQQGGGGQNIPKGPRGAPSGPAAAAGNGAAGVGPQRAGQRGQHGYHPYARDR
ncbi:hypothetical protein AAF712_003208 [Marasmius tenuissimus]|uniref:RRM domain-containing protein n=1 Tax=Marasmius tenuissimus TaxID=585030 RepID=A0ABR3A7Q0_9AGAR